MTGDFINAIYNKSALMCLLGGKMYTLFGSVLICGLRGKRVNEVTRSVGFVSPSSLDH